jgi:hypothetical protein
MPMAKSIWVEAKVLVELRWQRRFELQLMAQTKHLRRYLQSHVCELPPKLDYHRA